MFVGRRAIARGIEALISPSFSYPSSTYNGHCPSFFVSSSYNSFISSHNTANRLNQPCCSYSSSNISSKHDTSSPSSSHSPSSPSSHPSPSASSSPSPPSSHTPSSSSPSNQFTLSQPPPRSPKWFDSPLLPYLSPESLESSLDEYVNGIHSFPSSSSSSSPSSSTSSKRIFLLWGDYKRKLFLKKIQSWKDNNHPVIEIHAEFGKRWTGTALETSLAQKLFKSMVQALRVVPDSVINDVIKRLGAKNNASLKDYLVDQLAHPTQQGFLNVLKILDQLSVLSQKKDSPFRSPILILRDQQLLSEDVYTSLFKKRAGQSPLPVIFYATSSEPLWPFSVSQLPMKVKPNMSYLLDFELTKWDKDEAEYWLVKNVLPGRENPVFTGEQLRTV